MELKKFANIYWETTPILITLMEMLSQLKIFSIEATYISERDKRSLIKHFTVSSQFVEVRQLFTRKQFSWRKFLEAHKFKHHGCGQKEDRVGDEGVIAHGYAIA